MDISAFLRLVEVQLGQLLDILGIIEFCSNVLMANPIGTVSRNDRLDIIRSGNIGYQSLIDSALSLLPAR